jgi:hypothetical protein
MSSQAEKFVSTVQTEAEVSRDDYIFSGDVLPGLASKEQNNSLYA